VSQLGRMGQAVLACPADTGGQASTACPTLNLCQV